MTKNKLKIHVHKWHDAAFGTHKSVPRVTPKEYTSVGFLIEKNDEYIQIADHIDETRNIAKDGQFIPLGKNF